MRPDRSTTLVVLNNTISAELCAADLRARNIRYEDVVVILLREIEAPWLEHCAQVLRYRGRPPATLLGQARVIGLYVRAAAAARRMLGSATLAHVYIVNNDNLITNHLLEAIRRRPGPELTVVVEGIMNFQDITTRNRDAWRWRVKPLIAGALRLIYRRPTGHLSGAHDPLVTRVVSFAAGGLKAPPEKVVLREFQRVPIRVAPRDNVGLIVHTGLWQWMSEERYRPFAEAFADWVMAQGFTALYAKPHPRIPTGLLDDLLPEHQLITTSQSLEEMAGSLESGVVIGTCCTGLVTLKLLRPDLRCIDWGGEYYCEHGYYGDRSVLALLDSVGVERVEMPPASV